MRPQQCMNGYNTDIQVVKSLSYLDAKFEYPHPCLRHFQSPGLSAPPLPPEGGEASPGVSPGFRAWPGFFLRTGVATGFLILAMGMGTKRGACSRALPSPFLVPHLKHSVLRTKFQLPHLRQSQSPFPFSGLFSLPFFLAVLLNIGASTLSGSTPAARMACFFLSSASSSLSSWGGC